MLPTAQVSHAIAGRTRIRIADKRHDGAYFSRVQQKLAAFDGIHSVEANPLTASLLVHHRASDQAIAEFAHSQGLFEVKESSAPADSKSQSITRRAYDGLNALDHNVRSLSRGAIDFWGAVFVVMLGLGISELFKGNVSSPATTMLWYAVGALMLAQGKKETP
jgi:hypothetical protein